MRTLAVIFVLALISVEAFSQEQSSEITDVSTVEFKHLMDSLEGEVLIDLRTPDELRKGKIPGAIVIDFFGDNFEQAIRALDPDKTYLLYCASGGRSGETAQLLAEMGFKKIYNLETGFNAWTKEKMSVTRK